MKPILTPNTALLLASLAAPNAADKPADKPNIILIMEEARANSEFNRFWPLPEHRQNQLKWDKVIFDQLEHGIR